MTETDLPSLAERIDRVDRLSRRMRRELLAVCIVLCGAIAFLVAKQIPGVIWATSILLVSEDGATRGKIGTSDSGAWFALVDGAGRMRTLLDATVDTSGLKVYDEAERERVVIGFAGKDTTKPESSLILLDRTGRAVFEAP